MVLQTTDHILETQTKLTEHANLTLPPPLASWHPRRFSINTCLAYFSPLFNQNKITLKFHPMIFLLSGRALSSSELWHNYFHICLPDKNVYLGCQQNTAGDTTQQTESKVLTRISILGLPEHSIPPEADGWPS